MLADSRKAGMLSFPLGTAAGGLDFTPQDLVIFLGSNDPDSPFFSKDLQWWKFKVLFNSSFLPSEKG